MNDDLKKARDQFETQQTRRTSHLLAVLALALQDPQIDDDAHDYVQDQLEETILALVGFDGLEKLGEKVEVTK